MVSAEPLDAPHTTGNLNVALLYQDVRQEHIYLFQFPTPFPTFLPPPVAPPTPMPVDAPAEPPSSSKHVSFAADVKPSSTPSSARVSVVPEVVLAEKPRIDGVIGRLEVYENGEVRMVLGDGIVLDVRNASFFPFTLSCQLKSFSRIKVTAATQPSFLHHAVHLDLQSKRMCVVGEVNKRFVVSPNIDALLNAMDIDDHKPMDVDDDANKETTL